MSENDRSRTGDPGPQKMDDPARALRNKFREQLDRSTRLARRGIDPATLEEGE